MPAPETTKTIPACLTGTFAQSLAAMNDGQVLVDLDDALREATRAALDATQKAKITLDLVIVPAGVGIGDTPLIRIEDKIKVSLPKKPREKKSLFFADENFNPTRRNPNQDNLKLETIDGGKISKADILPTAATAAQ